MINNNTLVANFSHNVIKMKNSKIIATDFETNNLFESATNVISVANRVNDVKYAEKILDAGGNTFLFSDRK